MTSPAIKVDHSRFFIRGLECGNCVCVLCVCYVCVSVLCVCVVCKLCVCVIASFPGGQAPSEKSGKGPGGISVYFLSTITSQNFEEPIRLRNETMRNMIPSHAHEAKSADYATW